MLWNGQNTNQCYANGKEASYEEYKYLAEEGATDWGTEDVNLKDLINGEVEEKWL